VVVVELALAVILLVGAVLLLKSFWILRQVDPGFQAAGVLKAEVQLPAGRYPVDFAAWPDFKEMHAFTAALLERAARLPGVEAVAIAGNHPLDPGFTNSFEVVGREAEARSWPEITIRRVSPGYFRTVGLKLLRGRLIRDSDGTFAPPVLLINQAAADRFFPGRDPLGAQIRFWGADRTIVGVAANERFHGLAVRPSIGVYVPLAQAPSAGGAHVLLVRAIADPLALAPAVRAAIRELDPGLAVFGLESLEQTLAGSFAERRFTLVLVGLFASLALLIAAIGLYGVLSFGVARRTREIGVRMALGARPERVLGMVVGEGLRVTLVGITGGLLGALALTRLLASLLFGVTPTDPITFAAVAIFLALEAVAASYVPARRAARVDPAVALRDQ
jgi:predicted permease